MNIKNKLKEFALNTLPDGSLQFVKKIHYAHRLKSSRGLDEPDFAVIRKIVKPGDSVVDIGANIGAYSKLLSELAGNTGKVYSIEPIPATFEILKSNVKKLGLRNVELLNCAISSVNGKAAMQVPFYAGGGENFYEAHIVKENSDTRLRKIAVETKNLDSLLGGFTHPVSFIKCDTEGYELECIRGAAGTITKHKPGWLIEISQDPDDEKSKAYETFKLLGQYGYKPYWFDGKDLRERKAGDRSINYFFLTKEIASSLRSPQ